MGIKTLHDNFRLFDIASNGLVRQDTTTVDINLILDFNIVTKNRNILDTGPSTNSRVPANNGALHISMGLDGGVGKNDRAGESSAGADRDIRANDNVGADLSVRGDLSSGVDHDVTTVDVGLRVGNEHVGVLLGKSSEVEAGTREEILGLTNVHPVALEIKGVERALADELGEGFLFNGGGSEFNEVNNRGVEDVDTSIDSVANKLNGLLDESVNLSGVLFLDNDTVLGGFVDLGSDNGTLTTVGLVKLCELGKGIVTDDIGVEDKEGGVILLEDIFGKFEGTSGSKGFSFDGEGDVDTVFFFVLFKGSDHNFGTIVNGQDNVLNASGSQGFNLVENHGSVAEFDEGFGEGKSKGSKTGTVTTDENQTFHC